MNIQRWSETFEALDEALKKKGAEAAALMAAHRCLSSNSNEQLSADVLAFNALYPALIQDSTKPAVYIILKLAALCIDYNDYTRKSLDDTIKTFGEDEITKSWKESYWYSIAK